MKPLQPIFRFLIATAMLFMGVVDASAARESVSCEAPVSIAPQAETTDPDEAFAANIIRFRDAQFRQIGHGVDDRAVLSAASGAGHSAVRHSTHPLSGPGPLPEPPHRWSDHLTSPSHVGSLSQYRLANSRIVRSQYRALFPKHWFW